MTRWKVNIKLLPVKAHYFFYCAASAALIPFLPVIGKQMGISEIEVGVIYALAPILSIMAKPTVGIIADRIKKRKNFFLFFILLGLTSSLCLAFLPQVEPVRPIVFQCGQGSNYIIQCNSKIDTSCTTDGISFIDTIRQENIDIIHKNEQNINHNNNNNNNNNISSEQIIEDEQTNLLSVRELCHIRCEIHGYLEGVEFCKNLVVKKIPKMCQINNNYHQQEMEEEEYNFPINNTNQMELQQQKQSTKIPSHTKFASPVSSHHIYDQEDEQFESIQISNPYELDFDVLIKIAEPEEINNCLYLLIDEIKFSGDDDDTKFQKFSCLPNKIDLKKCYINCPNNTILNTHMERILPEESESFQSTTFWLFGLLVVITIVALSVVNSLSDALCFQLLGDKPHLYGRQRLLAAIGWGSSTLIAGYLVDKTSQGMLLKNYTPCFYMLGGLSVLDLIMSYKWEIKEAEKPKSLMKDMCILVNDLRIIIFFFTCVLVGMCTGIHWNFLFWLVEDNAAEHCDTRNWIKLIQGLMAAVQCFSEIPFFYYAGSIIKRFGHVNILSFVLFAFGIRLLIYSIISHPWAFIPIEMFQGITFGLFFSVMATYANEISPLGSQATVQGIVGAGFEGIGIASGSLVAGILFKEWGGKLAFRIFGIGALIFCFLHVLIMYFLGQKRIYGIPINDAEVEGQEMYKINGVGHDVETESE